jgi:hypothetical protein
MNRTLNSAASMSQMCQYRKFAAPLQQLHFGTWMPVEEPSTASKADIDGLSRHGVAERTLGGLPFL